MPHRYLKFDVLMEQIKDEENNGGYAPLDQLVDLRGFPFEKATETLRKTLDKVINAIESKTELPVQKYTIGKTYARETTGRNRREFITTQFDTWRLDDGVNGRWRKSYKTKGYDGLVVLCAVTENTVPFATDKMRKNNLYRHYNYTLALEHDLIKYAGYIKQDERLDNVSFHTGSGQTEDAHAGVIYVAFKLQRSSTDQTDLETDFRDLKNDFRDIQRNNEISSYFIGQSSNHSCKDGDDLPSAQYFETCKHLSLFGYEVHALIKISLNENENAFVNIFKLGHKLINFIRSRHHYDNKLSHKELQTERCQFDIEDSVVLFIAFKISSSSSSSSSS